MHVVLIGGICPVSGLCTCLVFWVFFFPFATGLLYGNGRLRQAVNYLVELSGYRRRMLRLMIKW